MKEQVVDIVFSQTPDVKVRVIKQDDDEKTKKHKKKFPFELSSSLSVRIVTNKRDFSFIIFKGYT